MGSFNRGGKRSGGGFGGDKSYGGGNRFGERSGGKPGMHQATCSECGADCEIPFRPTGDRPVFCSNCFAKQGNSGNNRPSRFGGERRERPRFEDRKMHDAVCAKCGNDCQVPFRPTAGKPVFCDNCFEKGGNGGKDTGEIMEQLKMLNSKIDKLVKVLTPNSFLENSEKIEFKIEEEPKELLAEKAKKKTVLKKAPVKKKKTKV